MYKNILSNVKNNVDIFPVFSNETIITLQSGELFLELAYADPRDSKGIYVEPGWDPSSASSGTDDNAIYKLYVDEDNYYYCRPYRAAYQAVRAGSKTNGEKLICILRPLKLSENEARRNGF